MIHSHTFHNWIYRQIWNIIAVPIPRWHQRNQKHRNEAKKKVTTTKNGNDDSIRYSLGSARGHVDHPLTRWRRRRWRRNPSSSGCLFVSHQENEVVVEAESFLLLLLLLLLERRRFEESGKTADMYGGRAPLCPRVKLRLEARPLALPSFPSGLLKTFNFFKLSKMFTFI